GFLEHVFEGAALIAHRGENEIAGAIDAAGQPVDTVGRQALADRLDHGDAARHRGLEGDDDAPLAGAGEDLVAMHRDQRLVGGDHVLAVLDGLEHQFERQGIAADQLDDDIDLGVAGNGENIVGNGNGAGVALGVELPGRDLRNLDSTPGTAGNLLGIALEHIEGSATDGSQPTDANFHRFQAALPIPSERPDAPAEQKSRTLRIAGILVKSTAAFRWHLTRYFSVPPNPSRSCHWASDSSGYSAKHLS